MENFHFTIDNVKLVSDIPISEVNGHIIYLEDGSVADLKKHIIHNKGNGSIYFEFFPLTKLVGEIKSEKSMLDSYEKLSIKSNNENLVFEVGKTDEEPYIEFLGTQKFINNISMQKNGGNITLELKGDLDDKVIIGNNVMYVNGERIEDPEDIEGKILIKVNDYIPQLYIYSNHKGNGEVKVPIDKLFIDSAGSSTFNFSTVNSSTVEINGSSTVSIDKVQEKSKVNINGSGNVNIKKGETKELDITINGSGSVVANVATENALLILRGSGDILVSKITQESKEVHQGSGMISVLQRGI